MQGLTSSADNFGIIGATISKVCPPKNTNITHWEIQAAKKHGLPVLYIQFKQSKICQLRQWVTIFLTYWFINDLKQLIILVAGEGVPHTLDRNAMIESFQEAWKIFALFWHTISTFKNISKGNK